MAQAVHLQQQRKDLELVFSLQSHYKHFFKNYGVIVGVYDIPSITMQWESFKSYLLKNSGLLFDNSPPITQSTPSLQLLTNDVHIRYVNTSGIELPINTQEDFQYALYTFRERARTGEINHLKLTRTKGVVATTSPVIAVANPVKCDDIFEFDADDRSVNNGHPLRVRNELSGGDGLLMADGDEKAPEWFAMYMQQFKQDIIQEITKVNTAQMSSNIKKMQAANHVVCPKRRQNKSEHYKRRPKMTYANNIAAMENTSCDNTDINTIATTPIIANPQKHSPPSLSKVGGAVQQPPVKSEIINKQIKLKAKRLVVSNINVRGSSDSDTVMKTTHHASNASKKSGNCKRRDKGFNFKQFVVQRMDQNSHKQFIDEEEVSQATLEVHHECPSPPENQLKLQQQTTIAAAKSMEVFETNNFKIENQMLNNAVYVEGVLAAKVLGEERMVSTVSENGVNQDVYMQTWRVENSGTTSWDSNTELQFGWGSIVPLDTTVPCPHLKPGESGCVSVFYKIPGDIGAYECYCHLLHHGRRFGPFLGFKATVTPATNSHQHPRTVITSIRQPQLPTNMTMSAVLANHCCNQAKPADENRGPDIEPTSAVMHRTVSVPRECRDKLRAQGRCGGEGKAVIDDYGNNDVVAVIQGVVVREGDVMMGRNCGEGGEQQWSGSFKRFKSNEKKKRSTDEKKTHLIKAEDGDLRFMNESQQKGFKLMQVVQNHPYCDYDSDSDYDDIDYYPDYFCNDKNIVKESLVKHKHQIQDNSDSDNASIISIADSNRDDGLLGNVSAAATIAGSFSSGTGSVSEEFVVIPMPKRTDSVSLFDCEYENDSCPELELELDGAVLINVDEKITEGVKRETENVNKPEAELKQQYTDGLPDSMTAALAIALKHLQQKKLAEQSQSLDAKEQDYLSKRPDKAFTAIANNIDHHIVQATQTVEKSNAKEVVANGKTNDSSYGKEWLFEQQTCPVDLSTHSIKVESELEQKIGNETITKSKPHCAASLCDLCTNIITKNRLFVFPEDSPGFEVFSSITKNSHGKDDLKTTEDVSTVSETRESLYKKMRAEDIGSSSFSPLEPVKNENIVQKTGNTYSLVESPDIQQNNPISTQNPTHNSTICDFLYPETSTPKQQQTAKLSNPCTFKSSLNLMNRGNETFYNSCSSSNDGTTYVCPSCQCEGLCGRYQDKSESDDRNCVETKIPKNANEIRSQMRDLFVQLAELEPMKDPSSLVAKVETKGQFTEDNDKSAASKRTTQTVQGEAVVKLDDSVLCDDQPEQLTDFRNMIQVCGRPDPLLWQRRLYDSKPALKRSKFAKIFPPQNVSVTLTGLSSPDEDHDPEYVETLAEQFQTNLRLADLDEPMPDVATDAAIVTAPDEQQEPIRDVCSSWGVSRAGCPFKTHLFQEHEEHPIVAPTQSGVAKLIDVPTPDGSFIEGATAPIENDSEQPINNTERDELTQSMEQERFIQLQCNEDTVLGDNMRTLNNMGFTNFYLNLQLLQANNNEIVPALEKLLPNM